MSTNAWATPEKIAEQMKREIIADAKAGKFTADEITSFSDLHDHVDANLYAFENENGINEELYPAEPTDEGRSDAWWETMISLTNEAQYFIDKWIQDGGLRASTREHSTH